jgi:DNA-binding SARP family transcriptional activator
LLGLQLFGGVRLWTGERLVTPGTRKQRYVLAVLALEVNQLVPTSRLVDLLWPDSPPASARRMIHGYVSGLRAVLAAQAGERHGVLLRGEPGGYRLTGWIPAVLRAGTG